MQGDLKSKEFPKPLTHQKKYLGSRYLVEVLRDPKLRYLALLGSNSPVQAFEPSVSGVLTSVFFRADESLSARLDLANTSQLEPIGNKDFRQCLNLSLLLKELRHPVDDVVDVLIAHSVVTG